MSVLIAFIGTNDYASFFERWYSSIKLNFMTDVPRTFAAFTNASLRPRDDVIVFPNEYEPWPMVTLKRWRALRLARALISQHDQFLYVDADMTVISPIPSTEIFRSDADYVGVHHPSHWLKSPPMVSWPGPWETNDACHAAVTEDMDRSVYWQGCLWGGKTAPVMEMIDTLAAHTASDVERGLIAKWFDESYLNRYFVERKPRVHTLPPSYAYPGVWGHQLGLQPRIVHAK